MEREGSPMVDAVRVAVIGDPTEVVQLEEHAMS
jgi:hypothetical protein